MCRSFKYANLPILDNAWLYIAVDGRDLSMCKVGSTKREDPFSRVHEGTTSNPFYTLYNAYDLSMFKISLLELEDLENYIRKQISYSTINKLESGNRSEWVRVHPNQAAEVLEEIICNTFEFNSCSMIDDDGEVIYSYLNKIKIEHRPNAINKAFHAQTQDNECSEYYSLLMDHKSNKL